MAGKQSKKKRQRSRVAAGLTPVTAADAPMAPSPKAQAPAAPPQRTSPAAAKRPVFSYPYIGSELKMIGILGGAIIIALVILSQLLS